jgi:hypothetical protein
MDTTQPDSGEEQGDNSQELCAPLDSLSVNGTPPAVGDTVEVKVGGKVSRIDGDNAYVTPDTVNGEPIQPTDNQPSDRDQMMELSQQADASGGMG